MAPPAPSSARDTSRSQNRDSDAAVTARIAPPPVTVAPVDRETRRPRLRARVASGTAAVAAPRVLMVAAIPDQALEPEVSAASSAPRESVAPIPIPPRICANTRTRRTRCWTGSFGVPVLLPLTLVPASTRLLEPAACAGRFQQSINAGAACRRGLPSRSAQGPAVSGGRRRLPQMPTVSLCVSGCTAGFRARKVKSSLSVDVSTAGVSRTMICFDTGVLLPSATCSRGTRTLASG